MTIINKKGEYLLIRATDWHPFDDSFGWPAKVLLVHGPGKKQFTVMEHIEAPNRTVLLNKPHVFDSSKDAVKDFDQRTFELYCHKGPKESPRSQN